MNAADKVAELQSAEIDVFRALAAHVPTRTMIDVGAHRGSTLLPFLEAGWRVWAFEPIDANRAELLARAGGCDRLTLRPEAVSRRSGTAQFHLALGLDGSPHDYYHSLERTRADRYHRKGRTVDAAVVSLDDLAARGEIPREVGFLKIDTEGHDLAVLQGAARLEFAAASVEFWGDRHPLGRSPSPAPEMIRLMAARGYEAYLVLCHQAGGTCVLGSSLEGVRPDAWGNLLFFHRAHEPLYRELLRAAASPGHSAPPDPADGRLVRLLALTFPGRRDLVVLQSHADPTDCAAELRAAFPGVRGVRVRPEAGGPVDTPDLRAAGRVDLIRTANPGDAAQLLHGARRVLAEHRPAVLASAAFLPPTGSPDALYKVCDLMRAAGYALAAVLASQVSEEGLLAAADFLFLPPDLHAACRAAGGAFGNDDPLALLEHTRMLQHACDLRLDVIRQLSETADERLRLIHTQQTEVERVAAAAEERLGVIRGLDDEVRRLRRLAQERLAAMEHLATEVKRLEAEVMRLAARWQRRPSARLLRALRRLLPGKKAKAA